MKLAREIATISYRSGPEWEQRFGRKRQREEQTPVLCPDFLTDKFIALYIKSNEFILHWTS